MQSNELYRLAYGFYLSTKQYVKNFSIGPWHLDCGLGQASLMYGDPEFENGNHLIVFSATPRELMFRFHDILLKRAWDDIVTLTDSILDMFFPDAHMLLVDTGEPGARAKFAIMRHDDSDWRADFEYFGGSHLSRHECRLQRTPEVWTPASPQLLTFDMMRGCL